MSILWKRISVFLIVVFVMLPTFAYAFKIGGLDFEDSYQHGSANLPLRGAGIKKFLSIRVVAVGLYLPAEIDPKDVLNDVPKSLEVIYLQNIPGSELQNATTKGIRLNVSADNFKSLEKQIAQINSYYPSVRKMDRICVTYIPKVGTTVELNGVVQGVIKGADFGRAFFAIWLGERPVDPRMKNILLKKEKQRDSEVTD